MPVLQKCGRELHIGCRARTAAVLENWICILASGPLFSLFRAPRGQPFPNFFARYFFPIILYWFLQCSTFYLGQLFEENSSKIAIFTKKGEEMAAAN